MGRAAQGAIVSNTVVDTPGRTAGTDGRGVPVRSIILPLVLLVFGCGSPEGQAPGDCADALDNDGDGLYDCDDPDFSGDRECQGADTDTDVDADTDTDTDTGHLDPCGVQVVEVLPADGSADAYHRAAIEFWLDDPDPGAPSIQLTGPAGGVAGSSLVSDDRELVWFEPSAPLEPLTTYQAILDYCAGQASIEFTTSALGLPCEADLNGRAFELDPTGARILEPAGLGELLREFLTYGVVVGVRGQSAATIDVVVGSSLEGSSPPEQDLCAQTADLVWQYDQAPWFHHGPGDLSIATSTGVFSVIDLEMSGTFAADGRSFGGGELALVLDMREWVDRIGEVDSAYDLCNLSASFGAPCQACPTDGAELCLAVRADRIQGVYSPSTTVEPIDAMGHPDCDGPTTCGGCANAGPRGARAALLGLLAGMAVLARRRGFSSAGTQHQSGAASCTPSAVRATSSSTRSISHPMVSAGCWSSWGSGSAAGTTRSG